jgi:hypothetical protein
MIDKSKVAKLLALIIGVGFLSGCASIVGGTNQSVSVSTPPVKGAKCTLKNEKGEWYVAKTPGSVVVHRAYGPLNIDCKKSGYVETQKAVKSNTKAMALGNVVFGGVVGVGVDAATGAAYDYPQAIVVPMKKRA